MRRFEKNARRPVKDRLSEMNELVRLVAQSVICFVIGWLLGYLTRTKNK